MTLLAVWAALLARYTGESDLVVGTAAAGRGRVELEALIGLFAENLVLRLDLAGDPGLDRIVARALEVTLAAWAHQDVAVRAAGAGAAAGTRPQPFSPLPDGPHPRRLGAPAFRAARAAAGASASGERDRQARPRPVSGRSGRGISGLLEYNRDLLDAATAVRLLSAFERLVEAAIQDPERRLSGLPILSAAERHQLLRESAEEDAGPAFVPRIVEALAAAAPEAPAVSGGELDRRAGRLARRLRDLD